MVQPLQGRDGADAVAELGIVVILHHPGAALRRPAQQLEAPLDAHDGAGGELVRGRDIDRARAAQALRVLLDVEPFGIHRAGQQPGPRSEKGLTRALVMRVLDADPAALAAQQARHQVQRLLRTVDDQQVVGLRLHTALLAQVGRQPDPQDR